MALIMIDNCPECKDDNIRLKRSREQSSAGGEMEWYCSNCSRVVHDGGRQERPSR